MRRFTSLVIFCLLLLVPGLARATMLGVVEDRLDPPEFYLIEEDTGTFEQIEPVMDEFWRYSNIRSLSKRRSDGAFYAVARDGIEHPRRLSLIKISPDPWNITTVAPLALTPSAEENYFYIVNALAFSSDDLLYASVTLVEQLPDDVRHTGFLVRLDPETGAEEERFDFTGNYPISLEFGPDESLYGWNPLTGLMTVDPATGVTSDVKAGDEDEPHVVSAIAFDHDGTLYGFANYLDGFNNEGWIYTIDPRSGDTRRAVYVGLDWLAIEAIAPRGPRLRLVDRPPRRIFPDSLFLIDCLPCPQCFGRMCDPRVNPEFDRFYIVEPESAVAGIISRAKAGLGREDGPLRAGAPVKVGDETLFAVSAPLADSSHMDAGAVLFLNQNGKVVSRVEGGAAGDMLGLAMDVRGNEVAVASVQQLLRLRDGKVVTRTALDKTLRAQQALRLLFTDDLDGDKFPEIRLGAPYATANGLKEAGVIQTVSSKTGKVLKIETGTTARQHLGSYLPPR